MKIHSFCIAAAIVLFSASSVNAQSFKDILSSVKANDVITSVTGGASLKISNVQGTWNYASSAVELSSDNILSSAAGAVATSQLEEKLNDACAKVGIKQGAFAFVFKEDMTFTSNIGSRKIGGSYTIDAEKSEITLNYGIYNALTIGKMTAKVTLLGDSMSLLFPADKLLNLIKAVSSMTSNESIKLLASLSEKYDGVSLGFELKREGGAAATESESSPIKSAASALGKWF